MNELTPAILEDLYIKNNYSSERIAKKFSIDKSTVCRMLKKHGIKSRKRTSKYPMLNNKEWLMEQYNAGRSMKNISEELGCSVGVVASSLYSLNVKTRTPKKAWHLKYPQGRSGDKHPLWQGGITTLSKRIRGLRAYKEWREKIIKRDKKCVLCGSKKRIEVDHIQQFTEIFHKHSVKTLADAKGTKTFWDIDNGRVLCRDCHKKQDTHSRKFRTHAIVISSY